MNYEKFIFWIVYILVPIFTVYEIYSLNIANKNNSSDSIQRCFIFDVVINAIYIIYTLISGIYTRNFKKALRTLSIATIIYAAIKVWPATYTFNDDCNNHFVLLWICAIINLSFVMVIAASIVIYLIGGILYMCFCTKYENINDIEDPEMTFDEVEID